MSVSNACRRLQRPRGPSCPFVLPPIASSLTSEYHKSHWTDSPFEANNSAVDQELSRFYEPKIINTFVIFRHLLNILSQFNSMYSLPYHLFKIHFNITFPSTLRYSKFSLSFRFIYQILYVSSSPHACHTLFPFPSSWFYHPNKCLWKVKTIKILVMQFLLASCYLFPLRSKYLLSTLFSKSRRPLFFV